MAQSISNTSQNKVKWGLDIKPVSQLQSPLGNTMTSTPQTNVPTAPLQSAPMQSTQSSGYQPTSMQSTPQQNSMGTALNNAMKQAQSIQTGINNLRTQEQKGVKGVITPPTTSKFGGIVDSLIKASTPGGTQTGLLGSLQSVSGRNQLIGEDARAISQKYADEIARVGKLGAGAIAGNLSTGTNVVGSGNAAIASQSVSQRMDALARAQASELEGTGQQLTGAQQEANALNQALTGANMQQQLQQQGLGSAATYAQPNVAGYGQTVFDPLTSSFGGGQTALDPIAVAGQLAQQVRNGQMTYEHAVASLGYAGGAGQQFLNQALGGNFNAPLSSANIQGQANVFQQIPQLESADVAAEGIKNKINTYLSDNPNLNPSDLAAGNKLQQWIEGKQLTDPKYQTLFNYLNEYTNTLAPILGVGGDPTNLKTEIAQRFVNAAASGQSIAEVLENMQLLSRGKIDDMKSGALGGGVVSQPYSSTSSSSSSGGNIYSW